MKASTTETKTLRIGLLGFGTVGSHFAEVLSAHTDSGVTITRVFNRNVARKQASERARFVPVNAHWTDDAASVVTAPDVDVVVELIGGLDPMGGWLESALAAGKHVVTANKQLIAHRGAELFALSEANDVQLLYNAAVAGGVPVIPGMKHGLRGDRIRRMRGILNGTCNFILSSMEGGADYAEVLKKAQAAGYAEADPSADVDGHDARAKLCILARIALRTAIAPADVPAHSITTVSALDFAYAKELGCTIRQVSLAELTESGASARVAPMLVPTTSPIAWSHGTQNMVVTTGTFGGDVVFSGHGAGGYPTAVAVMSDVLGIAQGARSVHLDARTLPVTGDCTAPHYIRFVVDDRPGIVAAIAGLLAKHAINIDSLLQHRGHAASRLPFVVTTEPCLRSVLDKATAEMAALDFMREVPVVMEIVTADDRAED